MTAAQPPLPSWQAAAPFALSLALIPLAFIGAFVGGWTVFLLPIATWYLFSALDFVTGLNTKNEDPDTPEDELFWYKMITLVWVPLQFGTLFFLIAYVTQADHLATWERIMLFIGLGVISGTVGINYSHELMHQRSRVERGLADILLAMVLYSHFRSEHLLVHHRYVATPRDPVTARLGEGFHRFYMRVLPQCFKSAWKAEVAMLERKGLDPTDRTNPFWMYGAWQLGFLLLALVLGGWGGLALFLLQAGIAIWQLELVNYIEHYGLTRKHLGNGKYEHVRPHHSWNAAHKASNWLLINLQRHSDHHYKPDRRFPVLQTYTVSDAPQLPFGYPIMTMAALVPPLWRKIMNPRVRKWRDMYYPEITDWAPYTKGTLPHPR